MHDRAMIVAGLLTFLALATFPVWYNVAARAPAAAPALTRPSDAAIARVRNGPESRTSGVSGLRAFERSCVAPRERMRTSHMQILATWRDDVVRQNARVFVAADEHRYEKNLTATCLGCHESRAQFCDRCHEYAGVSPRCPDCHLAPPARDR